jgi:hypothetical protein
VLQDGGEPASDGSPRDVDAWMSEEAPALDSPPEDGAGDADEVPDDDPSSRDDAGEGDQSVGDGGAEQESEPIEPVLDAQNEEAGLDAGSSEPVVRANAAGDADGDGYSDLALTGASGMAGIPTAFSSGNGTFIAVESAVADFPKWAAEAGAQPVPGDFDGDGRRDIALVGASTIRFAFSDGRSGMFRTEECAVENFAMWAQLAGNRPVSGDFDGDGRSDIALVGASAAWSIPVLFVRGGCELDVTNHYLAEFPSWATNPGAQAVSGDFNGDGFGDIVLTGMVGAWTIPIAFSSGDGTFLVTNSEVGYFPNWAQVAANKAVPGDFNGDGRGDIALTGAPGAWTIAVALSDGNGGFEVTNETLEDFPVWASQSGSTPVPGDFDGDGCGDIALVGASGVRTIPVAFSNCGGSFRVTNAAVAEFPAWAQQAGMKAVGGY